MLRTGLGMSSAGQGFTRIVLIILSHLVPRLQRAPTTGIA